MKRLLIYILIALAATPAGAQKNANFVDYIETYHELAIDQMRRHQVPASITLAQGILESAAGQSYLARAANNHFGIKVGNSWQGPWVTKDDETSNEKFRKYQSVEESFEDHSNFLHKDRYQHLFSLNITDYKGWAKGLKEAGYATNPQYPKLLISLIEDYELAQYDNIGDNGYTAAMNEAIASAEEDFFSREGYENTSHSTSHDTNGRMRTITHQLRLNNNLAYVVARMGDSYESIAYELNMNPDKLRKYNEVDVNHSLQEGTIVYLAKKSKNVAPNLRGKYHQVKAGESMYLISQLYGIKYKYLYEWNNLPPFYTPQAGDLLRVF